MDRSHQPRLVPSTLCILMDQPGPSSPVWRRQGTRLTHEGSKLHCVQAGDGTDSQAAAREGKHSCAHNSSRNPPRSCPSLWPHQTEEFPPRNEPFSKTPMLFMEWSSTDLHWLIACSATPKILDQYSRGLGTPLRKLTGLATLPFHIREGAEMGIFPVQP